MAIFKCKMCGGALEISEDITVAECEYCGSKQTVPSKKDEVITNLFNRANNLRLKNEFDKAAEVYNKILNENDADAEAHWGLVLCKYGIEYVEDPKTYKRIPTCHRTQYTSVLSDADYLAAIENADVVSKEVYTAEAKEIAELQKSILAIVKDEKPFDVFICYKETDETGKRTVDSTLANDIYYQLTKEGLRVFYAAITLEDKLGVEYEPYIFAALNSAKVMLAIGTRPEYFNAVWVKNEWSRYLGIMKTDREKMLIPCYRDMDAYDLPEEFAHLQAQDMSKIGFINDLVRGIKKVVVKDEPKPVKETVIQQVGSAGSTLALLKRGNLALEDHEWDRADGFFEEVLNLDAECAEAYLGKLLAKSKTSSFKSYCNDLYSRCFGERISVKSVNLTLEADAELLKEKAEKYTIQGYFKEKEVLDRYKEIKVTYFNRKDDVTKKFNSIKFGFENNLYTKAKRFADDEFAKMLNDAENEVVEKAQKEFEKITESDALALKSAKESFENKISAIDADNDKIYAEFLEKREKDYADCCGKLEISDDISELFMAASTLENMDEYKQSKELRKKCKAKIERLEAEKKAEKERIEAEQRAERERLEAEQKAREAEEAERKRIENERLKKEKNKKVKRISIIAAAIIAVIIAIIGTASVVSEQKEKANAYSTAVSLLESEKFDEAVIAFENLDDFKDSSELLKEAKYLKAMKCYKNKKFEEAKNLFEEIGEYKDSVSKSDECNTAFLNGKYDEAIKLGNDGKYEDAVEAFEALNGYKDSKDKITHIKYEQAMSLIKEGKHNEAYEKLKTISDHTKAKESLEKFCYVPVRVISDRSAADRVVTYNFSYDESGLLREVISDRFGTNTFSFDDNGKVVGVSHYDGTSATYTYNSDGTVLMKKYNKDGKEHVYSSRKYNKHGNYIAYYSITDEKWTNIDYNEYDKYNNITNNTENTYDENNNLISIFRKVNNFWAKSEIEYEYIYSENGKIDKDLLWKNIRIICEESFY